MRTIEINIFKFSELSESAKETARNWFRQSDDCDITDDIGSIKEFCDHFGVELKAYNVGAWSSIDYSHNAENHHFRGVKLKSIKRDAMPTGYYMDCVLWEKFHDEFKNGALIAFDRAIDAAFRAIRDELEYRQSDEYIDEMPDECEFTEDGEPV